MGVNQDKVRCVAGDATRGAEKGRGLNAKSAKSAKGWGGGCYWCW